MSAPGQGVQPVRVAAGWQMLLAPKCWWSWFLCVLRTEPLAAGAAHSAAVAAPPQKFRSRSDPDGSKTPPAQHRVGDCPAGQLARSRRLSKLRPTPCYTRDKPVLGLCSQPRCPASTQSVPVDQGQTDVPPMQDPGPSLPRPPRLPVPCRVTATHSVLPATCIWPFTPPL